VSIPLTNKSRLSQTYPAREGVQAILPYFYTINIYSNIL
jgi:hypothetical protein